METHNIPNMVKYPCTMCNSKYGKISVYNIVPDDFLNVLGRERPQLVIIPLLDDVEQSLLSVLHDQRVRAVRALLEGPVPDDI